MALSSNLRLKGRTYWVQKSVPRELRAVLGKSNLLINLQTQDISIAERMKPYALAEIARQLDTARHSAGMSGLDAKAMQWRSSQVAVPLGADCDSSAEHAAAAEEIKDLIICEEAEQIESLHGADAAQRFFDIAEGRATPVAYYLDNYLAEAHVADNTRTERSAAIRRFAGWAKNYLLEQITRKAAGKYVSEVLAKYHPATANKHITALSGYWKWLAKRGHIEDNPWKAQSFKVPRNDERAFTDREISTLLNGCQLPKYRDAMAILTLSGLRADELFALRVEHCGDGFFHVVRSKTGEPRKVPIHSRLHGIVRERTSGKMPGSFLLHEWGEPKNPITGQGRSVRFVKWFVRYRRRLGIDDREPGMRRSRANAHSFRRWFATKADHANIQERTIQSVLGHRPQAVLLQSYARARSDSQLIDCVEAVHLPDDAIIYDTPLRPNALVGVV